jgi:phage minor structural protein
MAYRLELYDNTNTTRIGRLVVVNNPRIVRELEGQFILSFELSHEDELYETIAARNYIRVINENNSNDYFYFIVQPGIAVKAAGNFIYKEIQCENIIYELANNIVPIKKAYRNITAAQAISVALTGSGFTLTTNDIPSSNVQSIEFDFPTSLAALHQIIDTWYYDDSGTIKRYYLSITQDKFVNITTQSGLGATRTFYIHPAKNLNDISMNEDYGDMANRIYAVGQDGFTIYRGNATDYEFASKISIASSGGDNYIVVSDEGIEADEYNGTLIYIYAGTGYGQIRTISDSVPVAGIFVSSNWTTNPDATSEFCLAAAIESNPCTYALDTAGGNSLCATLGTYIQVIIGANCYWLSGSGSDTCTFTITLEALDVDNNVLMSQTQELEQDPSIAGTLGSNYLEFNFMVGETAIIRKIRLTLEDATFAGSGSGRPFADLKLIKYSLSPNLPYVENTAAQATYGVIVGKYENSNIPDVINLVDTPALDGAYMSGLCENWLKIGSPTVTENTDTDYITQGVKSQKVVINNDSEGIYTRVYGFRSNVSHSLYLLLYIDLDNHGLLRLTLDPIGSLDNIYADITGTGWVAMTIENFSYDFSDSLGEDYYIDVKITMPYPNPFGSPPYATFYVDALQVNEGVTIKSFFVGDSADVLYSEAYNDLSRRKDPEISYALDMIDLYKANPVDYANEDFNPGDTVRVVHRDLTLNENILVVNKEFDPFRPELANVQLGNKTLVSKKLMKYMAEIANRKRAI